MTKISRILFAISGIIFPIFIGLLHTYVHFKDLVKPDVEEYLQKQIEIMGESNSIWNAWGVVSFMMGVSFILIGLLNYSTLRNLGSKEPFSMFTLLPMLFYFFCVIYVGYAFDATEQFYGGFLGLAMGIGCILTNSDSKRN